MPESAVAELTALALKATRAGGERALALAGAAAIAKPDGSPLTAADTASHEAICAVLERSGIPVVSEEGDTRVPDSNRFWLVDPVDGTKDFLADNGEYTVNVALIENGGPLLGVVGIPARGECFLGSAGAAWWLRGSDRLRLAPRGRRQHPRMAASRFHDSPDAADFARFNGIDETIRAGAALKFCLLAAGEIEVYPRFIGTSEWDTAAGQAVLEAVGGGVFDLESGRPLRYGKPRLRNPAFLALRAPYRLSEFRVRP